MQGREVPIKDVCAQCLPKPTVHSNKLADLLWAKGSTRKDTTSSHEILHSCCWRRIFPTASRRTKIARDCAYA